MKDKEPLSNEEIQNRIRKMMARRVERDYELSKKFMLFGSQGPTNTNKNDRTVGTNRTRF